MNPSPSKETVSTTEQGSADPGLYQRVAGNELAVLPAKEARVELSLVERLGGVLFGIRSPMPRWAYAVASAAFGALHVVFADRGWWGISPNFSLPFPSPIYFAQPLAAVWLGWAFALWLFVSASCRRAADTGLPAVLGLLALVPFAQWAVILALIVVPSSRLGRARGGVDRQRTSATRRETYAAPALFVSVALGLLFLTEAGSAVVFLGMLYFFVPLIVLSVAWSGLFVWLWSIARRIGDKVQGFDRPAASKGYLVATLAAGALGLPLVLFGAFALGQYAGVRAPETRWAAAGVALAVICAIWSFAGLSGSRNAQPVAGPRPEGKGDS